MIKESAPAKINLYLHITGRRTDGYHLLDSLVTFTDIDDEITLSPAPEFSFAMDGPFAGNLPHESNLAVRAAKLMAAHFNRPLNCAITLTKNLPVAAGIGGGSADAAAAMRALIRHWDISAEMDELIPLALQLGADVPACLSSHPQVMRGIGEQLSQANMPATPTLLVNPKKQCETKEIFSILNKKHKKEIELPDVIDPVFLNAQDNDLTHAACEVVPEIKDLLDALENQEGCALARLSGSGATCFGLFETLAQARAAETTIQKAHPDWWVKSGTTIA